MTTQTQFRGKQGGNSCAEHAANMPLGGRAVEEADIDRAAEGFDAGRMAFKEPDV